MQFGRALSAAASRWMLNYPSVRFSIWCSPVLYSIFALCAYRRNIYKNNYDILIDGYPRSANTYTVNIFELCHTGATELRVRSHYHSPAVVLAAVRKNMPTLIVMRKPIDAIAGWVTMSSVPIAFAISAYVIYYKTLLPHIEKIYVATFEEVICSPMEVVNQFNALFGTNFEATRIGEVSRDEIFERIDARFAKNHGAVDEMRISRPSSLRDRQNSDIRAALEAPEWHGGICEAERLYAAVLTKRGSYRSRAVR